MFYFVPAWYDDERPWQYPMRAWYRSEQHAFDDMVSQVRMFHQSKELATAVIIGYTPQLRYVCHSCGIYEVPCVSVFDWMQGIYQEEQNIVDFKQLNWPEDAEFIYTPFLVSVYQKGMKIAAVEFGNDGQLLFVDKWKDGKQEYRYCFDDRGFLSSVLSFVDGVAQYQDYLNPAGIRQFREYLLPDCHQVVIGEEASYPFLKSVYEKIEDAIQEILERELVQNLKSEDRVVVAAHTQHNRLLLETISTVPVLLSYYRNRCVMVPEDLEKASLILVDTLEKEEKLYGEWGNNVLHLSPFDTRLALGKSQRLKELILYFIVDDLGKEELASYLEEVFIRMSQDERIILQLVTYETNENARRERQQELELLLESQHQSYLFLKEEGQELVMFEYGDEQERVSRVRFDYFSSERMLQAALEKVRLVVDVSEQPDLYTQIAAISAGIPQINRFSSEFVEHLKNGYIIQKKLDFQQALSYYFDGLHHWNEALVHAVQKMDDYTSGRLVQKMKEKIEENGN